MKLRLQVLFALIGLGSVWPAWAQHNGIVEGRVVDARSGETLIGVHVVVEGTSMGTTTDLEGRFALPLPAGTYTLVFQYLGYQPYRVVNVRLEARQRVALSVALL